MKLLSFFLICALNGYEIIDHEMDGTQKKKTGVYKLSDKEKALLQKWIDTYYEKRKEPIPQEETQPRAAIEENLQNGQWIRLSDHTLWEIHPEDTPTAQGWITPVDIIVVQTSESDYSYKLTNSLTGSSLRARKGKNP